MAIRIRQAFVCGLHDEEADENNKGGKACKNTEVRTVRVYVEPYTIQEERLRKAENDKGEVIEEKYMETIELGGEMMEEEFCGHALTSTPYQELVEKVREIGRVVKEEKPEPIQQTIPSTSSATRRTSYNGNGRGGKPGIAAKNGADSSEVRKWARIHGYQVADRGRINDDIIIAYNAAH